MKKEAVEVLKNRRSIRKYKTEQIKPEELDLVLELGTYAPTSRGLQCPKIVAVQDAPTIAQLSKMNAKILAEITGRELSDIDDPYFGAPTIVLVFAPGAERTRVEDGSAVMTQLCLGAYAVGLGSCWVNRERQMFELEEGKELMKKWGLDEDYIGIGGLSLGYADCEHPEPKARKDDYILKV
ncbi:MAG: nitroreductase family protein [Defluviitaleaceae bacterium]|nr:nitroreductase family protein [Defluviitaleaceae bacterium]